MCALVCFVSVELATPRRDDGRAWDCCGPFDSSPLGDKTVAATGKSIQAVQTQGRHKLEDGRDLRSNRGSVVVGARQMEQVMRIVEKAGARMVLLGDTKQTEAIEAGKPFAQLP